MRRKWKRRCEKSVWSGSLALPTALTYDQLTEKTNQYVSKLRKGDVALVYLAAHAVKYRNEHLVLTRNSDKINLAHTSLRVPALLLR